MNMNQQKMMDMPVQPKITQKLTDLVGKFFNF